MSRFENKVVVITGGNSGIGAASARKYVAEGAKVVIFGRNTDTLNAVASELGEQGHAVQGDVSKLADINRLFEETVAKFGKVDALFINAGIAGGSSVAEFSEEAFDQLIDINFKGAFFTLQRAIPELNDGAAVVLNTSISNNKGMPGLSVYGATKAALRTLAKTASVELLARNIRVNAVSPGPILTPIYDTLGMDEAARQQLASQVPMKRFGSPEELADAVLFLSSAESTYIIGTELVVDGGMTQL